MKKHSTAKKTTKRLARQDGYVTVTLPNGKKVDLYGDALEMAQEHVVIDQKVLEASYELLNNTWTPNGLYEAVAQFFCEQSNQCGNDLNHSRMVLREILKTVTADERRGNRKEVRNGSL